MARLESRQQYLYAPLNSRVDSATPSTTNPFYARWQTLTSACLCLLALTCASRAQTVTPPPPQPPPVTITVCASGCDQTNIAAAVAAAKNDDTIAIGAGTYVERVEISKNLTLRGVSASETILDGAYSNNSEVIIDPGATVSLQNVTVRHGGDYDHQYRGGVWVKGNLTVTDCLITENIVGLSNEFGIVKVVRTAIRNNQSNTYYSGAGIETVGGQTILFNSSVSGNLGGNIGAIHVRTGALSLSNSTVSGNSGFAVENIFVDDGATLSLANSTVAGSASNSSIGFVQGGQAVIGNSILSASGHGGSNCVMNGASVLSLGHNLSSDDACLLTDPTDLNNNKSIKLGPLQVNAPGVTETNALLAGSAAIDAGNCAAGLTQNDQRGVSRPQGPACDIGAYELRTPVANKDAYGAIAGRTLVVQAPGALANDVSPDGLPLSIYSVSSAANGSLNFFTFGGITYTPNPGFIGQDSVTYSLWDGAHMSNSATVSFNVTSGNTPPITQPDNYTVVEGQVLTVNTALGVLANDRDPDGDPLAVVPQGRPGNGTLNLGLDGSFTYKPNPGFSGTDSFTYMASDTHSLSGSTTVTITVKPNFGTITIALTTQPQSSSAFAFKGTLGNFTLGGSSPSSKTFQVGAGTWSITELRPKPWLLTNIVCNVGPGISIDLNKSNLQVLLNNGDSVTCTFVSQLPGQISVRAYSDLNLNGQHDSGEPWLRGWNMQVALNPALPFANGATGANGTVSFPSLQANIYTVCEAPPAGWRSTNPPAIDAIYRKPCFTIILNPGQTLPVLFGNTR